MRRTLLFLPGNNPGNLQSGAVFGADGIILMEHSAAADAKMRMFNADGSEGTMAGNALR